MLDKLCSIFLCWLLGWEMEWRDEPGEGGDLPPPE